MVADALPKEDAAAAGCRRGKVVRAVVIVPNPAGFTGSGDRKVGEGPGGSIAMDARGGSGVGIGAGGGGIGGGMEGLRAGKSGIRAGARSLNTGFWRVRVGDDVGEAVSARYRGVTRSCRGTLSGNVRLKINMAAQACRIALPRKAGEDIFLQRAVSGISSMAVPDSN